MTPQKALYSQRRGDRQSLKGDQQQVLFLVVWESMTGCRPRGNNPPVPIAPDNNEPLPSKHAQGHQLRLDDDVVEFEKRSSSTAWLERG